jgi:hypothetical protein
LKAQPGELARNYGISKIRVEKHFKEYPEFVIGQNLQSLLGKMANGDLKTLCISFNQIGRREKRLTLQYQCNNDNEMSGQVAVVHASGIDHLLVHSAFLQPFIHRTETPAELLRLAAQ